MALSPFVVNFLDLKLLAIESHKGHEVLSGFDEGG
jgi:hypothetical protein